MPATPFPPDDPFPEKGDFDTRRDWFARRLEGRSREDCILIAARAALRVLPNLTNSLPMATLRKKVPENAKEIIIPVMRCHALSVAASLAPTAENDKFQAVGKAGAVGVIFSSIDSPYATQASYSAYCAAAAFGVGANSAQVAYKAGEALAFAAGAANTNGIVTAFEVDFTRLDGSHAARERLAASPLWLNEGGAPKEILDNWKTFSTQLRALSDNWDVWAEWYGGNDDLFAQKDLYAVGDLYAPASPGVLQGAKNGRYLFGLPTARALKLWHDVALLPNDLWQGEPAALNARFKELVAKARGEKAGGWEQAEEIDENSDLPTIPSPKPSAIEPVWEDGRLILPAIPALSDGSGENVLAALQALKEDFSELVEDAKGEANIDDRAIDYLSRLAARIPNKAPTNLELHRIAQNESALQGYGKTVADEWPDFLAVRYHALALQFTRAMAQFPNWREFKRIATQADLTKEQVEEAPKLAREFAEALRDTTLDDIVDPAISDALESFAALADSGEGEGIILSKEMLAVDLLNGIETTLIRLAEAALAFRKGAGQLASKAWNEFAKRAQESIVEQAGKAGDSVGPAVAKLLKKCSVYGGVGGGTYYLGWLEPILKLLG